MLRTWEDEGYSFSGKTLYLYTIRGYLKTLPELYGTALRSVEWKNDGVQWRT